MTLSMHTGGFGKDYVWLGELESNNNNYEKTLQTSCLLQS